jgi:hypothetical protein
MAEARNCEMGTTKPSPNIVRYEILEKYQTFLKVTVVKCKVITWLPCEKFSSVFL